MVKDKIPWSIRTAYALPAFALAIVGIPIYVYLPKFYTDVMGVPVIPAAAIILGVRVFDALSDPMTGILSDHTKTPLGRRRPYLILGAIPLASTLFLLFNPPHMSPTLTTWWFGLGLFALFLSWTIVAVPYEALGPEITFDYDERTAVLGTRDGFLLAGTLVAAASPAIIGNILGLAGDALGERARFFWLAVLYGPLLIAACWWCAFWVREKKLERPPSSWAGMKDLRQTWNNRPFRILLVSYVISALGSNLPATLILYYVEYVLLSVHADLFLLLYFVTGVAFLPLWIYFSKRFGKKESWLLSMGVNSVTFAGVFFLGAGDEALYGILVFFSGIGLGGTLALPSSMQADVIDYHEYLTGKRQEGNYIGIWSISKKLAAALGVGSALFILGLSGYIPQEPQPEQVITTLRTLYALVPSLCNVVAIAIALAYPIDKNRHQSILRAIELQKRGLWIQDPLK